MTYAEYKKQRLSENTTQSNSSNSTNSSGSYAEYKKQRLSGNTTSTKTTQPANMPSYEEHLKVLKSVHKEAQEKQQAWNDVDKVNSDYSKYMQSVNNTLAPKLYQTDSMQNILANKNVITPQEINVYEKGNPVTQSILKLQNFAKENEMKIDGTTPDDLIISLSNQANTLDKNKQKELMEYISLYDKVKQKDLKSKNYIGNRAISGLVNSISGTIDAGIGLFSDAPFGRAMRSKDELYANTLKKSLNLVDKDSSFYQSANQKADNMLQKVEQERNKVTERTKKMQKYNILGATAENLKRNQQGIEEAQNIGGLKRFVGDVTEGVTGMTPTILVSAYTQNPELALKLMSTSAGGNAYREAINEGQSNDKALAYGTLMGIKEYATEKMFGTMNRMAGFDVKGYGDELSESIINQIFKENSNKILKGFAEYTLGGLEEGLEEFVGDLVEPYIKNLTLGTKEKAELKNALYSGLVGGITGLAMGAPGGAINLANDMNANVQNNENSIKLSSNLQQNVENGQNNIQNQTNNVQNISNLENNQQMSISDVQNTQATLPSEIQDFVENRNKVANGLNVQLDNTLNTDGVMIKNQDGTRTIKINPRSTRAYEFVAMHEMLHDLEGTSEYEELAKFVQERAMTHDSFEEAKKTITDKYTQYYKANGLNMSNLNMDVETVNDMTAQALGNQQFLNELAGKKPNVFMKMYNWVKNVLFDSQKTGKTFSERRTDNKYLNELKKKFETAYNTAYKENSETKYSIQTDNNGNKYVKVDTDQNIFEGVETKDYPKIARMYMQDYLKGNTALGNNSTANIGNKGISKYTNPIQQTQYKNEKMKLSTELNNILAVSEKVSEGLPTKDTSKFPNWEYYKVNFEIDGKTFEGLINIGVDKNGNKHFYDINKIRITSNSHISASKSSNTDFISNSIPSTDSSVNNQYMQNSKNNSEEYYSIGGNGYSGYSMSNNAIKTYKEGKKPISKFTKEDVNTFNQLLQERGIKEKITLKELKTLLEKYSGSEWHHTSSRYNKTNFYDINDILENENSNIENAIQKIRKSKEESNNVKEVLKTKLGETEKEYYTRIGNYLLDKRIENYNKDGLSFLAVRENELRKNQSYAYDVGKTIGVFDYGAKYTPQELENSSSFSLNKNNPSWSKYLKEYWDLMPNSTKTFALPSAEELKKFDNEQNKKAYGSLHKTKFENIANMTEEDIVRSEKGINYKHKKDKGTQNERKFFENAKTSKIINDDVKESIDVTTYERQSNAETLEKAKNKLDEKGDKLIQQWESKTKNFTAEDVAIGAILIERYQQQGDNESAVNVVQKLADMGTEVGRAVQMYSIFQRLTPEAMMIYQQRKLNDVFKEISQRKTGEWVEANKDKFKLTAEDNKFITEQVEKAQQATSEREKQIELAKIEKRINDKLPPERGQTIKAIRRMAMLFNPKTQVRNVVGNALIMPVNDVADAIGTQIDKLIAKKTGVRTTNYANYKEKGKGIKKGITEAVQDYKMGIRTELSGSKYEFNFGGKSFNENTKSKTLNAINNKLNGIENLLGAVMSGGDRPFYEAAFNNSLQGQMKANNVTTPTTEMIDIAVNEALSRTWNDNNAYTEAVLGVRRAMNKLNIGGFGLGDLIIPFAKTPANLTKAIVEYSPVGLVEAVYDYVDMKKAISRGEMTAMQQKKFVNSMSKTIAGSILYLIAGVLARTGAITGSADDDKDVRNFEQNVLGIQPYSIKIGDKTFTYSWANPLNAPLAIMTDTYKMSKNNEKLFDILYNAFITAGEVVVDNSFLQGIKELFEADSTSEGLVDAFLNMPSQFVPTFLSQFATLFDKNKRQTFEYGNKLKTTVNQMKNKIPRLKNTLAPTVNTFGEEVENYGGDNNIFNVFFNPANVSEANATDTQKKLYSLYEITKDKTIFPRQAPYYLSDDGEKINLSSEERMEYQKASGQYVTENLGALFDSEFYKSLENEDKIEVINEIVSDADTIAKDKWIDNKTTEKVSKRNKELDEAGIPLIDYYNAWLAKSEAEGKKNSNGKTISGTKKKAQIKAINEAVSDDITPQQKKSLYKILNVD